MRRIANPFPSRLIVKGGPPPSATLTCVEGFYNGLQSENVKLDAFAQNATITCYSSHSGYLNPALPSKPNIHSHFPKDFFTYLDLAKKERGMNATVKGVKSICQVGPSTFEVIVAFNGRPRAAAQSVDLEITHTVEVKDGKIVNIQQNEPSGWSWVFLE
eukprot:TRINITY_DN112628_c0_g1_i1.p1 TRINITY_DN112628_c0_g1~~TRINITY_DN112628_c0_g1_i1.p1  ORF type:complete len:159 (-),score=18.04 TRINITY_DN112628_c0_g1_i1:131-607(-)